ncbi:glycosyltransferase family 4 protein [soil metagenome]
MLFAAAVTAVVTGVLTPLLAAWARGRRFLDVPNARSSHVVATPRIGGVALVLGVFGGVLILHLAGGDISRDTILVLAGALAIGLLGLADDFWQLPALGRLAVQAAVAVCVVLAMDVATLPGANAGGWIPALLVVFWLVTLTNAFNFMDGIDGIAGAQALVAGTGWAAIGLLIGMPQPAALGLLLAAAGAGFLLHNWQPAKVFMGDAGSGFFGFLFAALPLLAPAGSGFAWWCAVLLMWPFLFDTGFTLLRRIRRGENLLSAHRSHIYQRLVLTGRSHRHVALVYAGLALLGAMGAVSLATGTRLALLASVSAIVSAAALVWWNLASREDASRRSTGAVL